MSFGDNKLSKRRNLLGTSLLAMVVSAAGAGCSDDPAVVPVGDSGTPAADAPVKTSAATPTFSVPGGTYATAQTVTIASATAGAKIYYTVDNNTPNTGSQLYTAPLSITSTTTVRAFAVADGYNDSSVNSATYTIATVEQRAATPTITPAGGTYATTQTVSIATTETGGTIIFTTNGSLPSKTNGTVYTAPFSVAADTTVIAVTTANNKTDSLPATATYKITVVPGTTAAPSLSPAAGEYTAEQSIVMTTATPDAVICYTVDGNTPGCDSTKALDQMCTGTSARYVTNTPPKVNANTTVKALACKAGSTNSSATSAAYTFRASLPTVTASGTVAFDTVVFANVTTPTGVLLYTATVDGTTPADPDVAVAGSCTQASGTKQVAAGSFPWNIAADPLVGGAATTGGLRRNAKYKFRACRTGYNLSAVVSADYNAKLTAALDGTSPAFGVVNATTTPVYSGAQTSQTLFLGTPAPAVTTGGVCYTNDGTTTPACNSTQTGCTATGGTWIAGAGATINGAAIADNQVARNLRVVACKPGATDSDVLAGTYSFQLRVGAEPGTTTQQNLGTGVNIKLAALLTAATPTTATTGTPATANVYYTTNGTTPVVPTTCGGAATLPTVRAGGAALVAGLSGNIDLGAIAPPHSATGSTFKLIACATDYTNSAETTVTFTAPGQLTAPVITPASGTYATALDTARNPATSAGVAPAAPAGPQVYFSRASTDFICWTDNGSDPVCNQTSVNCTAGTVQAAATLTGISESSNFGGGPRVVKARSCKNGSPDSPIASASYTFKLTTPVLPAGPSAPFGNSYQSSITGNVPGTLGVIRQAFGTAPPGTIVNATWAIETGATSAIDPVCGTSAATYNLVSVPRVVKVRACSNTAGLFTDSDIATASYTTAAPVAPVFTIATRTTHSIATPVKNAAGKYQDYFDLSAASTTTELTTGPGATAGGVGICYTTDGTAPACGSFTGATLACLTGTALQAANDANPSGSINPNPTAGSVTVRAITCSTGLTTNVSAETSTTYSFAVSPLVTTAADADVTGNKRRGITWLTDTTVTPNAERTTSTATTNPLVMCVSQVASPPAGCTVAVAGSNYYCFNAPVAGGPDNPTYDAFATKNGTVYIRACKSGLEDSTATYTASGITTYVNTITGTGGGATWTAANTLTAFPTTDTPVPNVSFDSANIYLGVATTLGWTSNTPTFYWYLSGAAPYAVAASGTGFPATVTQPTAGLTSAQTHGFGTVKYVLVHTLASATTGTSSFLQWNGTAWTAFTGPTTSALTVSNAMYFTVPRSAIGSPTSLSVMGGIEAVGGGGFTTASWPAAGATWAKRLVLDLTAGTHPAWPKHVCDSAPAAGTSGFTDDDGPFLFCP